MKERIKTSESQGTGLMGTENQVGLDDSAEDLLDGPLPAG